MTTATPAVAVAAFDSFAALRNAHNDLLAHSERGGSSPALLRQADELIRRARATGSLLDSDAQRQATQTVLDYWAAVLYRAGAEPPDTALVEFDASSFESLANELCPYPGLRPFGEHDKPFFFGREASVRKMVELLADKRVLAVVGAPTSGKTSLVRAGLLPALKDPTRGLRVGSAGWRYFEVLTPGAAPLESLASALLDRCKPADAEPASWVAEQVAGFQRDQQYLARLLANVAPAVMFVDQFEDVLLQAGRSSGAQQPAAQCFLDNLEALFTSDVACRIIVAARLQNGQVSGAERAPSLLSGRWWREILPLGATELQDAIVRPAAGVGLQFHESVWADLVRTFVGVPNALPLLQFVLHALWDQREARWITPEVYQRVLWDPARRRAFAALPLLVAADRALGSLDARGRERAESIFLRLVGSNDSWDPNLIRLRRDDLHGDRDTAAAVDSVVDAFGRAGVLRVSEDGLADNPHVEITHESVPRFWQPLRGWLEANRAVEESAQRVEGAAKIWQENGRPHTALLRGPLLAAAEASHDRLHELGREFVDCSQKEAIRQRRVSLVLRMTAIAAVVLIFGLLAGFSIQGRTSADEATARSLADEAQLLSQRSPEQALLDGLAADQITQSRTGLVGLLHVAQQTLLLHARLVDHRTPEASVQSKATTLAFSGDGRWLVAGYAGSTKPKPPDGSVVVWDLSPALSRPSPVDLTGPPAMRVTSLAFSPDGRLAVGGTIQSATEERPAIVATWDLNQPGPPRLLWAPGDPGEVSGTQPAAGLHQTDSVSDIAFGSDHLIAAAGDRGVILWDTRGGGSDRSQWLPVPSQTARHVAFSADGRTLAALTTSTKGAPELQLWRTPDADPTVDNWQPIAPALTLPAVPIRSLAFSPRGNLLVAGGDDGSIAVWDTAEVPHQPKPIAGLRGNDQPATTISFTDDGNLLAVGACGKPQAVGSCSTGEIRLVMLDALDPTPRVEPLASFASPNRDGPSSVALQPHSHLLALGDSSGVLLWDLSRLQIARPDPTLRLAPAPIEAASASGTRLAAVECQDLTPAFGECGNYAIELRDVRGGVALPGIQLERGAHIVDTMAFDATGDHFAAAWTAPGTNILSIDGPGPERRELTSARQILSLAFSDDGRALATGEVGGVTLWDVASGAHGTPLDGARGGETTSVAFSHSPNPLVAYGQRGGSVYVWNPSGTAPPLPLQAHKIGVEALAFSPGSDALASGDHDGTIVLWDPRTGKRRVELAGGHTAALGVLTFSADGALLASGDRNGVVAVWDVQTGNLLGPPMQGPSARLVNGLAFGAGGESLRATIGDVTISWPLGVPSPATTEWVCAVAFRGLSQQNWEATVDTDATPWNQLKRFIQGSSTPRCGLTQN